MCCSTIRPHKGQTDLAGYIWLCAEIGLSYNQGLALAAALQCLHRNKGITNVLNVELWVILKMIVLRVEILRVGKQAVLQEFVLDAGRATIGLGNVNPRTDIQGRLLLRNERRVQPQAPRYPQQAAYGAMKLLPSQRNSFLNLSGQPQEVQDWTSVPPPTQD